MEEEEVTSYQEDRQEENGDGQEQEYQEEEAPPSTPTGAEGKQEEEEEQEQPDQEMTDSAQPEEQEEEAPPSTPEEEEEDATTSPPEDMDREERAARARGEMSLQEIAEQRGQDRQFVSNARCPGCGTAGMYRETFTPEMSKDELAALGARGKSARRAARREHADVFWTCGKCKATCVVQEEDDDEDEEEEERQSNSDGDATSGSKRKHNGSSNQSNGDKHKKQKKPPRDPYAPVPESQRKPEAAKYAAKPSSPASSKRPPALAPPPTAASLSATGRDFLEAVVAFHALSIASALKRGTGTAEVLELLRASRAKMAPSVQKMLRAYEEMDRGKVALIGMTSQRAATVMAEGKGSDATYFRNFFLAVKNKATNMYCNAVLQITADGAQDPSVRCEVTGDMANRASSHLYQLKFWPCQDLTYRPLLAGEQPDPEDTRSVLLLERWMKLMHGLCLWGQVHYHIENDLIMSLPQELRAQIREPEEGTIARIKETLNRRIVDPAFLDRLVSRLRRTYAILVEFARAEGRTQMRKQLGPGMLALLDPQRAAAA